MSLYALVPLTIGPTALVSSTIPEPSVTEAAWNSLTTYTVGQVVILSSTHRRYKALQSSTGVDPSSISALNVYWADDGPTSRWAMFDGSTSYKSEVSSPLTAVLRPGAFNSIYLGGLVASDAAITVLDAPGGNVIHSSTHSLEDSEPGDWYEYWFSPFSPRSDLLITGIEPYRNSQVTITLTGGSVECAMCATGDVRPLGTTVYGAKASPKSYSTIKTVNGVSTIVKRRAGNDLSMSAWAKLTEANSIHATLMTLIDTPCLWIGTDLPNYQGLRSWGLGAGSIGYDYPEDVVVSVEVTGLIK